MDFCWYSVSPVKQGTKVNRGFQIIFSFQVPREGTIFVFDKVHSFQPSKTVCRKGFITKGALRKR